jgi:hypothetical protein
MYNHSKIILLSLVLFSSMGCSISRSVNKNLSPPADTKWVNVEVKNPSQYTKPFPLEVRYISYECKKKRISGFDGSTITEPSYNVVAIPMQQGAGEHWQGKVARNGGGACKWTLSAINLGIEYTDATHLGKDLVPGTAVGATIAFDEDASRNGQFTLVQGDLHLSPKYYPYIRERHISENTKSLSLLGKKSFQLYRASNLVKVSFLPILNERKIVRFVEPEKKVEGVYSKIIYPDGSVAPDKTLFPDFNKVDGMSIK